MSSVYVIGQVTIKDPKRWMDYVSRVPATLAEWGGELVMRGQYAAVLSGPPPQPNIVVLRFSRHERCRAVVRLRRLPSVDSAAGRCGKRGPGRLRGLMAVAMVIVLGTPFASLTFRRWLTWADKSTVFLFGKLRQ